jgi:hypothetical protein
VLAALAILAPAGAAGADARADDLGAVVKQVEQLLRENTEMRATIEALRGEVRQARDEAMAARDMAAARADTGGDALADVSAALAAPAESGDLYSRRAGGAKLRLIDLSLVTDFAAGSSTARNSQLEHLQGGGHDPRQRGFTLQGVELSLLGAVDPYLLGEAHLIYFLDTEGESRFELEEAFATSQLLPFGLEEHGFEIEAGQFFTEFGRQNPRHPHQWAWLDQPVILSRLFGEDGMRGPGVRVGWLTPLPWYSEVHIGAQNATGETMLSFLANDEAFEERAIGGRPFDPPHVSGFDDFVYLVRWVNGADLSDTLNAQLGLSALFGPNATGGDGRTRIFGTDLVVKWRPLQTDRGWPYLTWESEFLYRDYRADDFSGCIDADGGCRPLLLSDRRLLDWGFYTQLLWGFHRGWATGLRYEYAGGHGEDFDEQSEVLVGRANDPYRSNRHRLSPLLEFSPSEFSRLRVQYNYDHVTWLDHASVHSAWAGVEFLIGSHAAHRY